MPNGIHLIQNDIQCGDDQIEMRKRGGWGSLVDGDEQWNQPKW